MNKSLYIAAGILAAMLGASCDHDPEPDAPSPSITISNINGKWASINPGGRATVFDFVHQQNITNSLAMTEYVDYQQTFSGIGGWAYTANTNSLAMEMDELGGEYVYSLRYRIDALDNNKLTLTNQQLGGTYEFKKIKDEYTLVEGEMVEMSLHSAWDVEPLSSPVAKVSGDRVTGLSYGTDFLGISHNGNSWYVRLTVQPEFFAFQNLMDSSPAEVRKKFGAPDGTGIDEDGLQVMEYLNPTSTIGRVMFCYNPRLSVMEDIFIEWSDNDSFARAEEYITSHCTWDHRIDEIADVYFDSENMFVSTFTYILYQKQHSLLINNLATWGM